MVTECRHPSVHPVDPWPDGPAWACDRCGQFFAPTLPSGADSLHVDRLARACWEVVSGGKGQFDWTRDMAAAIAAAYARLASPAEEESIVRRAVRPEVDDR